MYTYKTHKIINIFFIKKLQLDTKSTVEKKVTLNTPLTNQLYPQIQHQEKYLNLNNAPICTISLLFEVSS